MGDVRVVEHLGRIRALLASVIILLSGCAGVTPDQRTESAAQLALQAGWQSEVLVTDSYALMTFGSRPTASVDVLTVYIEGDGHAWVGGRYPSSDPTPLDPLALRLALKQPSGAVAYLGRPCQYLLEQNGPRCVPSVWTSDRFSAIVIDAMSQGLDQIQQKYGAKRLVLVGYSGGARIALELAAGRHQVEQIITVAGNLDPQAWVAAFAMWPLAQTLDNETLIESTSDVPQVHLVGDRDGVVPKELTEQFVSSYKRGQALQIHVVQGNRHSCCWVEQWPGLWRQFALENQTASDQ